MVDWSYDLLSGAERLVFDRLSVFVGRWTLEAAEDVCDDDHSALKFGKPPSASGIHSGEILDLLSLLLDKSMIVAEPSADVSARYRLLETLRQYAQQRLSCRGEEVVRAVRFRHIAHFT